MLELGSGRIVVFEGWLSVLCGCDFEGWLSVFCCCGLKLGVVLCVAVVNMCFSDSCCIFCVVVVFSVGRTLWIGEVGECSVGFNLGF